jgi:sterol desaturase/sphingolipid hydroxylase (fatty acid hydroxylase superfamily)
MKKTIFSLIQPATVALVVLLWAVAPTSLTENPTTAVVTSIVTLGFVQALEWFNERHVGWRLNRLEFFTDVFYVTLGFTVIDWLSSHLAENPLKAAKQALHLDTPWIAHLPFVVQVASVVFLIEFGQYWMHRAMHKTFLWYTHAPHHHFTQLNALKGAVGNPAELFLISLSVVALFDFSLSAIFCAGNVLAAVSSFAHANVRFDPPRWYSFFFTTVEHHSLHHSVLFEDTLCNYANSLILCDRLCGTFREGEAAVVGQDERKRLSIREQFMFPFGPLIAMIKARQGGSAAV